MIKLQQSYYLKTSKVIKMKKAVGKIMGKVKSVVLRKKVDMELYETPAEEKPVVEEKVVVEKKTTKAKKEPVKKSKAKKSEKNANTKKRV